MVHCRLLLDLCRLLPDNSTYLKVLYKDWLYCSTKTAFNIFLNTVLGGGKSGYIYLGYESIFIESKNIWKFDVPKLFKLNKYF